MEFIKRTCKKSRQELLNVLLTEEIEILRKKMLPYKKKKLLRCEVIIKEANFEDKSQAGQYNFTDNKHIILIDKLTIYSCHKMPTFWLRQYYKRQVKSIIKHELIHALVEQEFEHIYKNIKGKNRDASPVFLTVLSWCGGISNHDCMRNFRHTDNYIESMNCLDKYEDLYDYIIEMLYSYNEVIRDLETQNNDKEFLEQNGKIGLKMKTNKFEFANRKSGFFKNSEIKRINIFKENNKFAKNTNVNIINTFEIGCNVLPSQILELFNKKQDCYADNYNYVKSVCEIKNGEMKTIKVVKEKKNFG
ncbi:hypothetical protein LL033_11860 [Clostridium estertheticum]|uniref:hypothetical protein n=1 Tax=Clostridium estertheticum TaxID=238834 RepID=UPI001C0DA3E9|nr:hypothetical protein [Clostridium estertheticum]MBU3215847.1 hypothetical protein [Clostridium estertheticum]WAG57802.1 hypothetical protein LL033_11860 [Clostridium estertheticum]